MVLTGSGTQALRLALELAKKTEPSRSTLVALPAYSCYDLVTAAVGADVDVEFYDLDPVSLSPDATSLQRAVSSGARAVVGANLFGFPVDWSLLREVTGSAGLLLIEDASQGLGSAWRGVQSGSLGDMSVLSFGRGKGWTGGAGGALLLRSGAGLGGGDSALSGALELASPKTGESARAFMTCSALWALGRPYLYGLPASIPGLGLGETVYREPRPVSDISGYSAAAALCLAELSRSAVSGRRSVAGTWDRTLGARRNGDVALCEPSPGGEAGYLRYPVLAEGAAKRSDFVSTCRRAGVAPGYPVQLPELPEAQRLLRRPAESTLGASRLARSLMTLPTHTFVGEADVTCVVQALERF